jgi:hypothetical protein
MILMEKKLGLLLLTLFMFINLAGCSGGSYRITIGDIDSTKNNISGEYNSFSGHYFKNVTLSNGKALALKFVAETKKGELDAKVIDSDGNTVKTIEPGDTFDLEQPGKYKLQVEGEKHQGNFELSWEIE